MRDPHHLRQLPYLEQLACQWSTPVHLQRTWEFNAQSRGIWQVKGVMWAIPEK